LRCSIQRVYQYILDYRGTGFMADKSNKHVWEYLNYYLGLGHAPCFAVLLSGPWGVGKTYLLKKFLKERFGNDAAKYVYVSLYGLARRDFSP
jgi:predicted AAA+ superfamily ATPase